MKGKGLVEGYGRRTGGWKGRVGAGWGSGVGEKVGGGVRKGWVKG